MFALLARIIEPVVDWSGLEPDVPVRPAGRDRCLRGHDLSIASASTGFSRRYGLPTLTCDVCWSLRDPLASWAEVNPTKQHTTDNAPTEGFALVRIPPARRRGGLGHIQVRLDGTPIGDVDLMVCGPCQRAVLEHVRVDEPHRRRGYGRVLVTAAIALAPVPPFHWSTTKIARDDTTARAFWAAVHFPGTLGEPDRCTDMERAAGNLPDYW